MNKENIKKGLRSCHINVCGGCPYRERLNKGCKKDLISDALILVNTYELLIDDLYKDVRDLHCKNAQLESISEYLIDEGKDGAE